MAEKFSYYRQLLQKVDLKFDEIHQRHTQKMNCRQGCHSCCLPGLSVSTLEASYIANFLRTHKDVDASCADIEKRDPFNGSRCSFLDATGGCSIYEVRPIVCRSHGVPIRFENEHKNMMVDVCPLNFEDMDLGELGGGDFINIDTLNTILAAIAKQFNPDDKGERVLLKHSEISQVN